MSAAPVIKIAPHNRCFACTDAHGVYLHAIGVVFAQTLEQAQGLMLQALWDAGLNGNFADTISLREIPMTGAHVLWDGDY